MSVTAVLRLVPAKELAKYKKGLAENKGEMFSIDKTWLQFHMALRELPKPLSLAIRGDHASVGKLEGGMFEIEDEDEDEGVDVYLAYASPALVKKIAKALEKFSDTDLLSAIAAQGFDCKKKGDQRYYTLHFQTLRDIYHRAAKSGDAVEIFID